ncbi:MAG: ankyrin repeat domain-containing protein [Thermoplasmata archaeon]
MGIREDIVAAVKARDVARTEELLDRDPSVIGVKTEEGSLVLTAAYWGAGEVLELLLGRLSDLNIFEAAAVGEVDRVVNILESEPRMANSVNLSGYTPLGLSAFFGHKDVARSLVERGAEIGRIQESVNANTALDAAVAANRVEVAEFLLIEGARANARSSGGYTPLHKAAFNGNQEMVRLLLAKGAEVGLKSDDGKTPLTLAMERGHDDLANILRREDPVP